MSNVTLVRGLGRLAATAIVVGSLQVVSLTHRAALSATESRADGR